MAKRGLPARFYEKINKSGPIPEGVRLEGNCWLWTGAPDGYGYGRLEVNGKSVQAHRFSWTFHGNETPVGAKVSHRCGNKLCVQPKHLRVWQ